MLCQFQMSNLHMQCFHNTVLTLKYRQHLTEMINDIPIRDFKVAGAKNTTMNDQIRTQQITSIFI